MKKDDSRDILISLSFKKVLGLVILVLLVYLFANQPGLRLMAYRLIRPLLIAFAMAYILDKLICWLEETIHLSRKIGIALTLVLLILLLGFLGAVAAPGLGQTILDLLDILSKNAQVPFKYLDELTILQGNPMFADIEQHLRNSIQDLISSLGQLTGLLVQKSIVIAISFTSGIVNMILYFVIAIYMLIDKSDLVAKLNGMLYAFLGRESADRIVEIGELADEIFSGFFIGKMVDSGIIGILCFIILSLIGIPYASIIGLIVGITNMIPYFGPFIGAVPAILITLISSPIQALWVAIIILVLQQFDGLYLGPKIVGDRVGASPFWVLTGVTLGGIMGGVIGMFLGVPVIILIKVLLEEAVEKRLRAKKSKLIDEEI